MASHASLRLALPVGLAVLLCAAVTGITLWSYTANRRDALALTDGALAALEERISTQVSTFLAVPERVLGLAAQFAGDSPPTPAERKAAEETAVAVLNVVPMLALIGYADANGNWLMVRRAASGALETKIIARDDGARRAFWLRTAPDGSRVQEADPSDLFDPRTRPWWQRAQAAEGIAWTDVYVFFTDRQPGVTAARALRGGDLPGVVMADIRLDELSRFLASLAVGRTGRALILDGDGRLVALGDRTRAVKVDGDTVSPAVLNELADPVLDRAFDLYRVDGPGRRAFELSGKRHIVLATRLPGDGRNWSLLMVVPEDDFVGFVTRNSRTALLMGLGVMALAGLLAWQVVRQGLGGERARAALLQAAAAAAAEARAYANLAEAATPQAVLESLATALAARRAGLWRLAPDAGQLLCAHQFDAGTGTHASGLRLRAAEAPRLFAAITKGEAIDVANARADPRTADLARLYLEPMGATALLSLPVRGPNGAMLGAVWVEDRGQGAAPAQDFTRAAAALLTPTLLGTTLLAASPPGAALAVPRAPAAPRGPAPDRGALFVERLAATQAGGFLAAEAFPRLAVLAVLLTDDTVLATSLQGGRDPLIDRVARVVEATAAEHDVPYLRIMGERIVMAAGFPAPEQPADPALAPQATRRLAAAALALQDRLAEAFTAADHGLDFRLGLDLGPASGSRAGAAGTTWNVWGEAVRLAHTLAETAPPGTIQASQAVQEALAQDFILSARGKFFVPEAGELGTWLLAGTA
jgi:class 3 adenylate cyclase